MELHVLQVDQAGPDPVRHRHAMPDDPGVIGAVLVDLSQSAAGKHRFLRDDSHGLRIAVDQGVSAKTGQRGVAIFRVFVVVRERQQVDGDRIGMARHPWRPVYPAGDSRENGMARSIARMDDAAGAVAAFAGQFELARLVAVETDLKFIEQQFAHGSRPLRNQLPNGSRIGGTIAGLENVAGQQFRVVGGVVDDAALGPVAVGFQRLAKRQQRNLEPGLGRVQCVR